MLVWGGEQVGRIVATRSSENRASEADFAGLTLEKQVSNALGAAPSGRFAL
jgi:hypothetical protein